MFRLCDFGDKKKRLCNCRIFKCCVCCVLGIGDLFSNLYFGVFMIVFLMINVFLVNFLERFDMGKNKNCLKYYYVFGSICMCIWECMVKRKVYLFVCIFYVFSLEGYKFVYN